MDIQIRALPDMVPRYLIIVTTDIQERSPELCLNVAAITC